ncbi:hypothetical protein B0H67DRAFT_334229 [Lasiosphaeris hirsuta]|uniref:Uncharacterized protein n=1 Tax=Lasiosphaeris hirsuta TaxID=260670 RepID=A0AA40A2T5_9PEZI|nr:hypothetical protein B0H67DRAFT_334229 [Lasiosphaeris hirsuta]
MSIFISLRFALSNLLLGLCTLVQGKACERAAGFILHSNDFVVGAFAAFFFIAVEPYFLSMEEISKMGNMVSYDLGGCSCSKLVDFPVTSREIGF